MGPRLLPNRCPHHDLGHGAGARPNAGPAQWGDPGRAGLLVSRSPGTPRVRGTLGALVPSIILGSHGLEVERCPGPRVPITDTHSSSFSPTTGPARCSAPLWRSTRSASAPAGRMSASRWVDG